MLRLFAAVALPDSARAWIGERANALRRRLPSDTLRVVRDENFHVTLRFLGETDEQIVPLLCEIISAAAGDSQAASLTLGRTGAFPSARNPRAVWIDVTDHGGVLGAIVGRLGRGLTSTGIHFDRKAFRPHVTIGYVQKRSTQQGRRELSRALAGPDGETFSVDVNQIDLLSSELKAGGSVYSSHCHVTF